MRRPKTPNTALAELIEQAGFSRKGLARRVVDLGEAYGISGLAYDHSSLTRWLTGQQPKPPVPHLVARALTERLGRRITPSDIGMADTALTPDLGLDLALTTDDGIDQVIDLWKCDLERRGFLVSSSFAVGAYASATLRWLTSAPTAILRTGTRHVGSPDVDAVREVTVLLRKLDNRWGGGRARATVVAYLNDELVPLLRGSYTEQVGRDLYAVAAEMTQLAGWMAYDLERHGLAQRHLIQALQLAREAGDYALGAEILAGMAHQCLWLGHPGHAADLARASQISARKAGSATLLSESLVNEGHAMAMLGDHTAAVKAVSAAERHFDQHGDEPSWLGYFDSAYLSARIAHVLRELRMWDPAIAHARRSLVTVDGYHRGHMFNMALLASIHAGHGDIDQACALGTQALHLAAGLQSARATRYLTDIQRPLRPYRTSTAVRGFNQQVRQLTMGRGDM